MPMNNIDTGYKPDFALGALYAGENAANAEDANTMELIKQYLANNREMQSLPLDMMQKQYEAKLAQAKMNSPDYIPAQLRGQIGQMKTQEAAGNTAIGLQKFRQSAEQGQLENAIGNNQVLNTIQRIDKELAAGGGVDSDGNMVPHTPEQSAVLKKKREDLVNQLSNTAEFAQKLRIQEMHDESASNTADKHLEGVKYAADKAAEARAANSKKIPTTAEAAMTAQILENPYMDVNEKHQLLQQIFNAKSTGKNASGTDLKLVVLPDGKIGLGPVATNPPVKQDLPTGESPKPTDSNPEIKFLNGVKYQKVPGGWKKAE